MFLHLLHVDTVANSFFDRGVNLSHADMLHTPLFRRKDLWSIGDHSPHAPFPQAITSVLQDPGASIRAQHAALRQLEEFVHTLFTFKMPENFFWQIGAVAVFLLVVFVLGSE